MSRKTKIDTRAIGLDVGLAFSRFLTGKENLHYGLWQSDWEVCGANAGRAQEAYTEKLFRLLPEGRPLSILDIGGGAGETAKKLVAMGHSVDIVIPSAFLAERCRANAGPKARVHECRFEDFTTDRRFDLCLFSESYQYIPLDIALAKCLGLLADDGAVIIADCFRSDAYYADQEDVAKVGGGHALKDFRALLAEMPVVVEAEEDITDAVAPSVEIEQEMFNVIGYAFRRSDEALSDARPVLYGTIRRIIGLLLGRRRRERLEQRLHQRTRTAEAFRHYNTYLMLRLRPQETA
ncbi:MAG: class I SAM-dependent methyltransferase [Rhodobacteraceae bacterium]|nr:class I SAM-dependent methyltransferase [Paracoccaceae bacterium]